MKIEEELVKFQTSDGKLMSVEKIVISKCHLIKDILQDFEGSEEEYIPLPYVSGRQFQNVIDYCLLHMESDEPKFSKPLESANIALLIEPRYVEYIDKFRKEELIELINIAYYLNVPTLMELATAKLASIIKQMSVEELKQGFGLVEDMVAENFNQ